jgi:hypothetical protein
MYEDGIGIRLEKWEIPAAGKNFVPLDKLVKTIEELAAEENRLHQESAHAQPPGSGMIDFNRAVDIGRLIEGLTAFLPPLVVEQEGA